MKNEMTDVIAALEKLVGPLSLFLIARTEGNPSSMLTLVVSAAGLDSSGSKDATKMIIDCLKEKASSALQQSIARVNVRTTSDPLVQAITTSYRLDEGAIQIQNSTFNGVFIDDATVYKAISVAPKKAKVTATRLS